MAASAATLGVLPAWAQVAQPAPPPKQPVIVEAGEIRARPDVDLQATGGAMLRQGAVEIRADRLSYEQLGDLARAQGQVSIARDGNRYTGTELQLQMGRFEGYFANPTYFFSRTQAGGSAQRIDFLGEDVALATGGTYTSCPREGTREPAWLLSTDSVRLDFPNNEGLAQGAVLRFYGVPILAAPTLSFPLTDARKSGWLPPSMDLDSKSGFLLSMPYYWNIAPNRDATLTPTVITKRGLGLGSEFRYLAPGYEGALNLNVLAHDRLTGHSRGSFALEHEGALWGDGHYRARAARVSDDDYWKDFPRELPSLTPRLLATDVSAHQSLGSWSAYARVLHWQVLQDPVDGIQDAPYDRLPQIGLRGTQRLPLGLALGLETEFNRFTQAEGSLLDTRPTGARVHALGSLSWPYVTPGWSLVPKLSLYASAYEIDKPVLGTRFKRSVPSFSLDSAWVLERNTELFGRGMTQTLEPRLLYVNTPYRRQDDLPIFDTADKDFNFDSIYTDNAFSGFDRVSDANQLTAGVTTRVLDAQTGSEALRLGVAERFRFTDQRTTLNQTPLTQRASDVLLLGSTTVLPKLKLDAGVQYSPDIQRTVRSILGLRYTPGPYRTLNAVYRFKRDSTRLKADGSGEFESSNDGSEQVELGWQWPLYGPTRDMARRGAADTHCAGSWYGVGRVSYSMRDSRITDSVLGLEYDAGCWIGRVVAKRLSTSQQEATTRLGFEIEFVGLSRLGTNPLRVLKDNIPGYRLLRDDPVAPAAAPTAAPPNTP